ncbi:MAG TPA: endolytic transglycosylase MltG, partial [Streptosporangiaceae bacterium]|nr:endolytic transglycosylase MltG [Streptosporangiaceae bacterium]
MTGRGGRGDDRAPSEGWGSPDDRRRDDPRGHYSSAAWERAARGRGPQGAVGTSSGPQPRIRDSDTQPGDQTGPPWESQEWEDSRPGVLGPGHPSWPPTRGPRHGMNDPHPSGPLPQVPPWPTDRGPGSLPGMSGEPLDPLPADRQHWPGQEYPDDPFGTAGGGYPGADDAWEADAYRSGGYADTGHGDAGAYPGPDGYPETFGGDGPGVDAYGQTSAYPAPEPPDTGPFTGMMATYPGDDSTAAYRGPDPSDTGPFTGMMATYPGDDSTAAYRGPDPSDAGPFTGMTAAYPGMDRTGMDGYEEPGGYPGGRPGANAYPPMDSPDAGPYTGMTAAYPGGRPGANAYPPMDSPDAGPFTGMTAAYPGDDPRRSQPADRRGGWYDDADADDNTGWRDDEEPDSFLAGLRGDARGGPVGAARRGGRPPTGGGAGGRGPVPQRKGGGQARKRPMKRAAPLIALSVLVAVLGVAGAGYYYVYSNYLHPADYSGSGSGSVEVQIKSGDTAATVGQVLFDKGVVASARAFSNAAKASSQGSGLEPGFYRLHLHMSAALAFKWLITRSALIQTQVTIPEGWRESRIIATLGQVSGNLAGYQKAIKDTAALGLPSYAHGNPEGFLFPATYTIQPGEAPLTVLKEMVAAYNQEATKADLTSEVKHLQITEYQALIVASLVQAEGGRVQDFPKIARVIYNRWNTGMPL